MTDATRKELEKIANNNRETTERVTRLTEDGVRLVCELLEITKFNEYMGTHAHAILLAIEPINGLRPSVNRAAAKALLS